MIDEGRTRALRLTAPISCCCLERDAGLPTIPKHEDVQLAHQPKIGQLQGPTREGECLAPRFLRVRRGARRLHLTEFDSRLGLHDLSANRSAFREFTVA